jgi:integrase
MTLLHSPKSPLEDILIHLELQMGLRSVEVIRLRAQDVHIEEQYIDVRGKGIGEGKWRTVPIPDGSVNVFKRWIEERNGYIRGVKKFNPHFVPPDGFLLTSRYKHRPLVEAYTEQGGGLDKTIDKMRKRLGFHFSHHTLRRTFGRTLYHAKVDLPTISKIMGHEDVATTLNYLGVNMDDMTSAMQTLEKYQNSLMKGVAL